MNKMYFIMAVLAVIVVSGCKKDPDVNVEAIKIAQENVSVKFREAVITGTCSYSGKINKMSLIIGEDASLLDADTYPIDFKDKNFSVTANINLGSTCYYRYSIDYGASMDYVTEIKSFTNKTVTFLVNGVSFDMVYVEGGQFYMGAQKNDASGHNYDNEAYPEEAPVRHVTLSDYYIGKFEVTNSLWNAVMGNGVSYPEDVDKPVEGVTWDECNDFIEKLNTLAKESFSLPTEAQWEYAARGGNMSEGHKYSGSDDIDCVSWYGGDNGNSGGTAHNVGTKSPNELGVYDMSGNANELCIDYYYFEYNVNDTINPINLDYNHSSSGYRVYRGGSYGHGSRTCRVTYRGGTPPDNYSSASTYHTGFRLAFSEYQKPSLH